MKTTAFSFFIIATTIFFVAPAKSKADTVVMNTTVTTMPFSTEDNFQINSSIDSEPADFEFLIQNGDGLDYFPQPCNTGSTAQRMQCKAHNLLTSARVRIDRPTDMVIKLNGAVIVNRASFPKEKGQFVYHANLSGRQNLSVYQAGLPTSSVTIKVTKYGIGNVMPIAGFSFNSLNFTEPSLVSFSGMTSVDPDGVIVDYNWNFGDGSFGAGPSVNHIYDSAGQYNVTLTVTDNRGAQSSHSENIFIQSDSTPPVISNILPANNSSFSGSSVHLSGDSNESLSKVEIQVNSGPIMLATIVPTDSFKFFADIPFDAGGSKTILIRAFDVKNNYSETQIAYNLDFNNAPIPRINVLSQNSEAAPSIIWFDGSDTTDGDGDALTYEWNFGDGSDISTSVKPTHIFKVPGTYSISLTVTDAHGLVSTISKSISVSEIELPLDPVYIAPPLEENIVQTKSEKFQFLYNEELSPQKNVVLSQMDPQRVTPLHGRILQENGQPLSAVKITINGHPEYGYTYSREDGNWDLAVNGGGAVTVSYEKTGYTKAQRSLDTEGLISRTAPDVILAEFDQKNTEISFNSPTPQLHEASTVQDESGERKTQILIPENTTAQLRMPDGSARSIDKLTIRATEVTVGERGRDRMPGPLPPRSAYTFCADFTADEAEALNADSVEFSSPVPIYVDNFLNIPTGMGVPAGYFNPKTGKWEALNDGVVIQVLGVDPDLKAQIDVQGFGNIANQQMLDSWSITDSELKTIAQRFQPGQSFWRVRLKHFSVVDFNFTSFQRSGNDTPPQFNPPDLADDQNPPTGPNDPSDEKICPACEVDPRRQILFETIDLPGIDFKLHYSSGRAPGSFASNSINFNVFPSLQIYGETVRAADVTIEVAGNEFVQHYDSPALNTEFNFVWDGKDNLGRQVYESTDAVLTVSYYLDDIYLVNRSTEESQSFNNTATGFSGTPVPGRGLYKLSQTSKINLSATTDRARGANFRLFNGWSISNYHTYDPVSKSLYVGSGKTYRNSKFFPVVTNVAGNGSYATSGNGLDANFAAIKSPSDVTEDAAGNIFIADSDGSEIRKVDNNGIITHIAGNGDINDFLTNNDGPAQNAGIGKPYGIRVTETGEIFFTDSQNSLVRKIDKDGNISIFAGTGISGYSGDGGKAVSATLSGPSGLALDSDGSVYVADTNNSRIRKISSNGTITTFADGYSLPKSVIVDKAGNVYFTDTLKVYLAEANGSVKVVAGNNGPDFGNYEELGDATRVFLKPGAIALGTKGQLYLQDLNTQSIRTVNGNGKIQTVANTAGSGFNGNGLAARDTQFSNLKGMWIDSNDSIFVADQGNHRVRKIGANLPDSFPAIIASADGSEVYYFNEKGLHYATKRSDTGAVKYSFIHDINDRIVQIKDEYQKTTYLNRNSAGDIVSIVGPFGQTYQIGLDANQFVSSVTDPLSNVIHISYTNTGLMTSFQKPEGNTSFYEYDGSGRLKKVTEANGGTLTFNRFGNEVKVITGENQPTSYTSTVSAADPSNIITSMVVPELGNASKTENITAGISILNNDDLLEITQTLTPEPRYPGQSGYASRITTKNAMLGANFIYDVNNSISYNANTDGIHFVKTETTNDNLGYSATTTFNSETRTISNVTSLGRSNSAVLNEHQKPLSIQVGQNILPINYNYDDFGRIKSVSQGNRTTFLNYDQNGFLSEIIDPENRTTSFTNDLIGRILKTKTPDNKETAFSYDKNSNLVGITPPDRALYQFVLNAVDIISQFLVPGANPRTFAYDTDRRATETTFEDESKVNYTYYSTNPDENGNPTLYGKLKQVSSDVDLKYYYGATNGNRQYSPRLSVITIEGRNSGSATTFSWAGDLIISKNGVAYDYNFAGQPITENSYLGPVNYGYDTDHLLNSAGDLNLTRDISSGLVTQKSLGNIVENITYNEYGELSSQEYKISGNSIYKETYSRDKLGRITSKQVLKNGSTNTLDYEYDLKGRLSKYYFNGIVKNSYTYDAQGNRLTKNDNYTATYDGRDRILTMSKDSVLTTLNYADDVPTSMSANKPGLQTRYDFSRLGPLFGVFKSSGKNINYFLDGELKRSTKAYLTDLGNLERITYVYDKDGRLIGESTLPENIYVSRFIYASQAHSPDYMVTNRDGTIKKYFFVKDQLGSILEVVDDTGNIAQELEYDDFGQVVRDTNPGFQPFGFAGGLYDVDTGLTHFGARDYNPETGRWLERDPILFGGGQENLYVYMNNDPINNIDPSGLGAAGAIGGVVGIGIGEIIGGIGIGGATMCPSTDKSKIPPTNTPIDCTQLYKDDHAICSSLRNKASIAVQNKCWQTLGERQSQCSTGSALTPLFTGGY
jgi:RHS repeat-associated protein